MPDRTTDIRITVISSGSQARDAASELKDEIESSAHYEVKIVHNNLLSTTYAHVAIFIASGAGGAIVGAATKDIYEAVKRCLSKQIEKMRKGGDGEHLFGGTSVTIYGPDQKPLKTIQTEGFKVIEKEG
jgi:hypothetical protein